MYVHICLYIYIHRDMGIHVYIHISNIYMYIYMGMCISHIILIEGEPRADGTVTAHVSFCSMQAALWP